MALRINPPITGVTIGPLSKQATKTEFVRFGRGKHSGVLFAVQGSGVKGSRKSSKISPGISPWPLWDPEQQLAATLNRAAFQPVPSSLLCVCYAKL
jgi:hypothetical protein